MGFVVSSARRCHLLSHPQGSLSVRKRSVLRLLGPAPEEFGEQLLLLFVAQILG
jgi:hypothetical protein